MSLGQARCCAHTLVPIVTARDWENIRGRVREDASPAGRPAGPAGPLARAPDGGRPELLVYIVFGSFAGVYGRADSG
ncbi:hypothetical protein [Mycobacteroides salmoniphilum]|uniref:hypothetical protein n=1 Tax=Mycobacteroides salmoniphilum TaxID=404941 RepID=UPI001782A6E6|nr:hypothetical protein [Mycobacteroides salmoniphilum]